MVEVTVHEIKGCTGDIMAGKLDERIARVAIAIGKHGRAAMIDGMGNKGALPTSRRRLQPSCSPRNAGGSTIGSNLAAPET